MVTMASVVGSLRIEHEVMALLPNSNIMNSNLVGEDMEEERTSIEVNYIPILILGD